MRIFLKNTREWIALNWTNNDASYSYLVSWGQQNIRKKKKSKRRFHLVSSNDEATFMTKKILVVRCKKTI